MKCPRCGAEGILVNEVRGVKIYQCPNWDFTKKWNEQQVCDYGCWADPELHI